MSGRSTVYRFPRHNHLTRDIKAPGICPACDRYWAQRKHPASQPDERSNR